MIAEKPIEQLFEELLQSLKDWGMSEDYIRLYYYEGIRPIRVYYNDADMTYYDEAFTANIVADLQRKRKDGIIGEGVYKRVRKIADMMKNYDEKFIWNHIAPCNKEELNSAYYLNLLNNYRDNEYMIGIRAKSTINNNVTKIRYFFRWLENSKAETLEHISLKDIGNFLTHYGEYRPHSIGYMLGSLRKLDAFIKRQNIASVDFSPALTARPAKRSKLSPAFTQSEAEAILAAVDINTPLGKRNYAILIIAKELGVRAGDIANLKLSDIRWENNELRFSQNKTGAELVLPLEPIVGNAIADYILNGRPETDTPYVFVRSRAPYEKISKLFFIVKKYAPCGEFEKFSGFHSFRRCIASQMLNTGVAADTVKGILGQTKINSLKPYARISAVRLKSCAINLTGIETTREVLR